MSCSFPRNVAWIHLGQHIPYLTTLHLQNYLVSLKKLDSTLDRLPDMLLTLEHSPTFTIGRRAKLLQSTSLPSYLQEISKLKALGSDFVESPRGGLMTFHGPGQLVCYPILTLKHFQQNLNWYIRSIQNTIMDVCGKYGIKTGITDDVGVWVEQHRKIAAIGFHTSRWITSHGFAINVNLDLNWFRHIIPCGLKDKNVTSLKEELQKIGKNTSSPSLNVNHVQKETLQSFSKIFQCHVVPMDVHYPDLSTKIHDFLSKDESLT